jgi:hypothetical protein
MGGSEPYFISGGVEESRFVRKFPSFAVRPSDKGSMKVNTLEWNMYVA